MRRHQTCAIAAGDAATCSCVDSDASEVRAPHVSRRGTLAAMMALAAVAFKPRDAVAAEEAASAANALGIATARDAPQTVYFG